MYIMGMAGIIEGAIGIIIGAIGIIIGDMLMPIIMGEPVKSFLAGCMADDAPSWPLRAFVSSGCAR